MTLKSVLPEKSTTYKYGSSYIRLSTQRALLTNLKTTYDPTVPVSPANLIPFLWHLILQPLFRSMEHKQEAC